MERALKRVGRPVCVCVCVCVCLGDGVNRPASCPRTFLLQSKPFKEQRQELTETSLELHGTPQQGARHPAWLDVLRLPASHQGSRPATLQRKKKNTCHTYRVVVVQVAKLRLTLCNPMDCSTPGFPVRHYLLELAQTHVHRVSDAIQPFHPLSSPSPPTFSLSQHQGLF